MKKASFSPRVFFSRRFSFPALLAILLLLLPDAARSQSQKIIVDHTCTRITQVPEAAITAAKQNLHIAYGHTSHGSQLTDGMTGLVAFANGHGLGLALADDIFAWNEGGTGGALDLRDYAMGGDVGYYPDWVNNTRSYLGAVNAAGRGTKNPDVNVVIWSWCGQASGLSEAEMASHYLAPMNNLENEYFGVRFVYMTGHLDGSGSDGNLAARNNQIRDYCNAHDKTLYDFADIESYDPEGSVYYMPLLATDGCDYDSDDDGYQDRNWAIDWQNGHTENVDWYDCPAAHTQPLNGNLKAYAAWWLWARLGGWSGSSTPQYAISGRVTAGSQGLPGVTISGLPGNPVTNGSGHYSVMVDEGWSGTAVPSRPYYAFVPSSTAYDAVAENQTTDYATTLNQSLVVTSPASGFVWEAGTTQAVTWLQQGAQSAYVRINLYKGTSTWVATLAAKTANDGSFGWAVPMTLPAGGSYFIRVQTFDNRIRDDSDKFTILVPAITVTAPAAGTVWARGTTKTITWNKVGTQDANVRIQLYRGTTKALDITLNTPNSGTYDWAIPATLANAVYTVRITTLDGKVKGVSKTFSIVRGMIKVTAPAPGARWQRGIIHAITWSGEGLLNANVRIQLLKGDQVSAIVATTPNDGSFDWVIPANKALANYKIRVTTVDNQVTAKSGLFAITNSAD